MANLIVCLIVKQLARAVSPQEFVASNGNEKSIASIDHSGYARSKQNFWSGIDNPKDHFDFILRANWFVLPFVIEKKEEESSWKSSVEWFSEKETTSNTTNSNVE